MGLQLLNGHATALMGPQLHGRLAAAWWACSCLVGPQLHGGPCRCLAEIPAAGWWQAYSYPVGLQLLGGPAAAWWARSCLVGPQLLGGPAYSYPVGLLPIGLAQYCLKAPPPPSCWSLIDLIVNREFLLSRADPQISINPG